MQIIRIGLIGAGRVAQSRHIPRLQTAPDVELKLVWNRTLEKAQSVAKQFGFQRAVADWREITKSSEVDAVVIATPPNLHRDATLAALAAGKHVLCQARMSRNLKEALEMREAADKSGLVTCLYPPAPGLKGDQMVKRLLANDYVGEIREVRVSGTSPPDENLVRHWRMDPEISGVNMMQMGMWQEVLERWVGPAKVVTARTQIHAKTVPGPDGTPIPAAVPDSLVIAAEMKCGASASYHFSSHASYGPGANIELYGSKGAILYSLFDDQVKGATKGMVGLELLEPRPDEVRTQTTDIEFIAAIRGGPAVSPSFDEGVSYMEFCEAVAQSAYFGRAVTLPPQPLMSTWGRSL